MAWAVAATALAEGDRTIAVVPIAPILGGASDKSAEQITEKLADELEKSDSFRLIPIATGEPPPSAPAGTPPFQGAGERELARGRGLIAHGEHEMTRLRFDQAAQDFNQAIALIESSFDSLESFTPLTDAYLDLAIAKLRLGQREAGTAALQAFVRLAPDRELPRGKYPAIFLRMQKQAQKQAAEGPHGTLVVSSALTGQPVLLDGRDGGLTPATLQVIPGRHFVLVKSAAGQVAYRVDVPGSGQVTVGGGEAPRRPVATAAGMEVSPADVETVRSEIRANRLDPRADLALGRIARTAGTDFLLLGGLHPVGGVGELALDLVLYGARTHQLARLSRIRFDGELLGAGVEVYNAVQALPAVANPAGLSAALVLPVPVAADLARPAPKPAPPPPPVVAEAPRPAPRPSGADDEELDKIPEPASPRGAGEARRASALAEAPAPRAIEPEQTDFTNPDAEAHRSHGSAWLIGGIAVGAAVAIVAGVLIYEAVTARPTQGLATVSW